MHNEIRKILKRKGQEHEPVEEDDAEMLDQQVINENRKNMKKSAFVFFPDSNLKTVWDLTSFVFTMWQSMLVPYRISFDIEATGVFGYFEYIIDSFFMIDILVNFNTGYYKKGNLIMQRKYIVLNYVISWFFLDFFASLPYSWFLHYIFPTDGDNQNATYLKTP